MSSAMKELETKVAAARAAAKKLARLPSEVKNQALLRLAENLVQHRDEIMAANQRDRAAAVEAGMSAAMQDRLLLDTARIAGIASDVRTVAALPDPVGEVFDMRTLPNGLQIGRKRVPLGVIATIYESRPNVTVDISTLCLKSGNAVILRGGKEAIHSNLALAGSRAEVGPRGGRSRGRHPDHRVHRPGGGGPHAEDERADRPHRAPGRGGADQVRGRQRHHAGAGRRGRGLPHLRGQERQRRQGGRHRLQRQGAAAHRVQRAGHHPGARGDRREVPEAGGAGARQGRGRAALRPGVAAAPGRHAFAQDRPATDEDWGKEFLALIAAVKVVESLDEALEHIDRYGSGHSEAIVTEDYSNAMRFLNEVDAACVYVNASTRFTDGGQFGLGAEVGISTQKFHARGPMGLKELTSYKWIIMGSGQTRP